MYSGNDPSATTTRIAITSDGELVDSPGVRMAVLEQGARIRRSGKHVINVPQGDSGQDRYAALFGCIYDSVLATDEAGVITDANSRALDTFGYKKSALCGMNVVDVVSGANASLISAVAESLAKDKPVVIDAHCSCSNGFRFPAEIAVSLIHWGNESEMMFFVRDVTQRKEMERVLRETNKRMTLHIMAGGVAHDFNNLLTSVIGNIELAMGALRPKSKGMEDLAVALGDAERMAGLSRRMLAYSGRGLLTEKSLDLNKVLRRAVKAVRQKLPDNVTIELDGAKGMIEIGGVAPILESMLSNLINNAVEAIGRNVGTVTVSAYTTAVDTEFLEDHSLEGDLASGEYACLRVSDTGYGMDKVTVGNIFDPYFSTKGEGRGLGLSEAQGVALTHGGAIAVDTELGVGSTIMVLLPLFRPRGTVRKRRTRQVAPESIAGSKILVIDDEPSIRRYSRRILEKLGFSVLLASDGHEGVSMFREHADEIDLVLVDVFMPSMNGDEALKRIREIRPAIKALVISGYVESVFLKKFNQDDSPGFLYKPFATRDFVDTVTTALLEQSGTEHASGDV